MDAQPKVERWEKSAEWPLAALALIFLAVYSVDVLVRPQGDAAELLSWFTKISYVVFAVDYVTRLSLASHRPHWFFRHLFDLAVVALPLLRPLRLLRLVVLIGALQKAVGDAIRGRIVLYTVSGAVLLIYVTSLAVLEAERPSPDSHIKTFGQAVWWAMTTVTTVGYGDYYPVTPTGRVVAALLMLGGIGLVAAVTATLASWIVQRVAEADTTSHAATAGQIAELRSRIDLLTEELRQNRLTVLALLPDRDSKVDSAESANE